MTSGTDFDIDIASRLKGFSKKALNLSYAGWKFSIAAASDRVV